MSFRRPQGLAGEGLLCCPVQADVDLLRMELRNAGDVDIFLTNDWPEGVQSGIAPPQQPKVPTNAGALKLHAQLSHCHQVCPYNAPVAA